MLRSFGSSILVLALAGISGTQAFSPSALQLLSPSARQPLVPSPTRRPRASGLSVLTCSAQPSNPEDADVLRVDRRGMLGLSASGALGLSVLGAEGAGAREKKNLNADADNWPGFLPERVLTVKGKEVKILQEFNEKRKNGMAIYEGNLVLSNYLQSLPESYWKGKKVLELGCGTGFGSVTASLCGAESVTASDRDPNVLNLAKKNLVRNLGDQGSFKTARVAWGTPQCTSENTKMDVEINACWEQEVRGSGYDLVIGADLTYTAELIPKIIETIKLFGSPKAEVVFCWCEPDLFNWNTDVMDQLNQGIKLFDKEFKVESIKSGPIVEGHPNTFLLHMRAKQA